MPDIDIASLVQSCQAGHLDDFDPLYQEFLKPIYGFIYRRTLVRETAEDLTSMTFIKALEKIGTYKSGKGAFQAWLFQIARNTLTDYYRSNRPTSNIEDVWDLASEDISASDSFDTTLHIQELREALKKLSADKRDIILMRLWDNLSYKEIAAITGKTETNCKVIVSRSIDWLRKELPVTAFILLFIGIQPVTNSNL